MPLPGCRHRAGATGSADDVAKARTGKVPKPSTRGGTAVNPSLHPARAPVSRPRGEVLDDVDAGAEQGCASGARPPGSVSSMFSESMPTRAAPDLDQPAGAGGGDEGCAVEYWSVR